MTDAVSANPFESYAVAAKPVWQQKQERAALRRRQTMRQKTAAGRRAENDELRIQYNRAKKRQLDEALEGPHGRDLKGVLSFLRSLTPASGQALVKFIKSQQWLAAASEDIRYLVLAAVGRAIARVRTRADLAPFDDGLSAEEFETTAFGQIKTWMGLR